MQESTSGGLSWESNGFLNTCPQDRKIYETHNEIPCYNKERKEEAVMLKNIKNVMAAIDYIESHLHEKLDLEKVARAVHYSKYHLHRMFTDTVGGDNP